MPKTRAERVERNGKRGRPRVLVNPQLLRKLAEILCTYEEMAQVLEVSESTLKRHFGPAIKRGAAVGKCSLRRLLWKSAQSGNVTAQIWLSKNLLGMRDNFETPPAEMPDFVVRLVDEMTPTTDSAVAT